MENRNASKGIVRTALFATFAAAALMLAAGGAMAVGPAVDLNKIAQDPAAAKADARKTAADTTKAAKAAPADAKKTAKDAGAAQRVNINTAAKAQIEKLPGIGPVKAQAIIDGRPYKTKEDVMKIKGLKEGVYKKIEGLITVQ